MSEHEKYFANKFKEDFRSKVWLQKLDLIDTYILALYYYGFGNADIATILGTSSPAISVRIKKMVGVFEPKIWQKFGQKHILTKAGREIGKHCFMMVAQFSAVIDVVSTTSENELDLELEQTLRLQHEDEYPGETNECGYLGPWR